MSDKFGRLQDIVDIILCMTFGCPKSTVLLPPSGGIQINCWSKLHDPPAVSQKQRISF